jgi:hypothetical protein
MEKQEALIQYGEDCETVLKSEAFNRVVNTLVEQTFQNFVNSKPEDNKERSITYYHYRALVDVVNTLKQQVSVKDEILASNDKEGDISQEEA